MADLDARDDWTSLPQGVLQTLASTLSRRDFLTCRLVCKPWSVAMSALIERLRIHVAAGCSNTAPPQGRSVRELLQQALLQLEQVSSVTLVLTQYTTGPELADALQVVGSHEQVKKVAIWEVMHYHPQPRSYAKHLRMSILKHVEHLVIRSPVTWNLSTVWQQICTAASQDCPAANDRITLLPNLRSLRIQKPAMNRYYQQTCVLPMSTLEAMSAVCQGSAPVQRAILPNLHHLHTPLPGQHDNVGAVVCTISASHDSYLRSLAQLAPALQSLTIGGPNQGDLMELRQCAHLTRLHIQIGALLRAIPDPAEEDSVISRPLFSLSNLQQLDIWGEHGIHTVFKLKWLSGLPRLEHLTAFITQPTQDIAQIRPDQLRSLCAMQVPKAPTFMAQIAAVGKGLTALTLNTAGYGAFETNQAHTYRRNSITLQPYLTTLHNLQSLTLLSGTEYLAFTIQEPAVVWQALPKLARLKLQGVGLGYTKQGRPSEDRHSMQQDSNTRHAVVQSQNSSGLMDSLPMWVQDLPRGLQELELSRYMLVLPELNSPGWQQTHSPQSTQASASPLSCSGNSLLQGLQKLVLYACCAVFTGPQLPAGQTASAAGPTASPAGQAASAAGQSAVDSEDLACLMATAASVSKPHHTDAADRLSPHDQPPAMGQLLEGSTHLMHVHNNDLRAVMVPVWQLLCLLENHPQLKDLQLLRMFVSESDITYISNHLGDDLQTLLIHATSLFQSSAKVYVRAASVAASILTAAAQSGRLQQLSNLELLFDRPSYADVWPDPLLQYSAGCGVDACQWLCGALGSLKRLKIMVMLQSHLPPARFYAKCVRPGCFHGLMMSPDAFYQFLAMIEHSGTARPSMQYECCSMRQARRSASSSSDGLLSSLCSCNTTWDLSGWQHLQSLEVKLCVPPMDHLGDLEYGTIGKCKLCGGGLGLEACRWFFTERIKELLPCCEVLHQ